MRDKRAFSRIFGRVWPLALFSLPGVAAVGIGLWVGYRNYLIQMELPFAVLEGAATLSIGLILSGLLAFFAGLILSTVNALRGRVEDVAALAERAARRPVETVFSRERFVEQPAELVE
jgi:hypothetical protein